MKFQVPFIVSSDIISPYKRSVRLKWYLDVSPSVCPYVSARLTLDGFPWYINLGTSVKIYRENRNLVKIGQKIRALYMKI
jgi:hypothetical protein